MGLSPFISEERRVGDYVPPEEKEMLGLNAKKDVLDQEKEEESEEEEEDVEETEAEKEETKKMKEAEREEIKKMKVERGKPENIDQDAVKKKLEDEEYRLRVMMV